MLHILTYICCLILVIKSDESRERAGRTECAARRCCKKRRGVLKLQMLHDTLCEPLTAEECGAHDETCVWDCHQNDYQGGKRGFTDRHFVRVSDMKGKYVEPQITLNKGAHQETFEDCMASGHLIERDDCGVEYQDEMDQKLLRQFCSRNHEAAEATRERAATGQIVDDVNDNSTDIGTRSGRRRAVFGSDGRVVIPWEDRNYYLWRKTVYLTFTNGNGGTRRCTASMISRDWAITSAHCVWGGGDWYGNWKIYTHSHSCPGSNDNEYKGIRAVTFTTYINNADNSRRFDWDIAWIKLDKGTSGLGWFGYGYSTGFSGNEIFDIVSYPADKGCNKMFQSCVWSGWELDRQTTSECDTYRGASGAPIYRVREGYGNVVYAVLSAQNSIHNIATRITKSKYNAIKNYV